MLRLISLAVFSLVLLGSFSAPSLAQQTQQQLRDAEEARRRAATRQRIDDDAKRVEERRKVREAERAQRFGIAVPAAAPAVDAAPAPTQKQRRKYRRR
jgi:hypothetical protein